MPFESDGDEPSPAGLNPLRRKLALKQQSLTEQGLLRQRQVVAVDNNASNRFSLDGKSYLSFSSNDYLGLSREPELADALHRGALDYGVGSGASPLVTGYNEAHARLERLLCDATGHEAALLFCSGFGANSALMKTLFDKSDRVIADKLIHASIIDGLQDSGAGFKRFRHNDIDGAERLLRTYSPCALVTESVFSMDGDIAPLAELSSLCRQHNAWLIVDDAHGFGILGDRGLGASRVVPATEIHIDAQLVTFGKALGCQGAAILGSQSLIDFLVANARHYIYSTALSPANAEVASAAVELMLSRPEKRQTLMDNIDYFKRLCRDKKVPVMASQTPIQPVVIGDSQVTLDLAQRLKDTGLWVGAIRPPTVPQGSARLRVTLSATHSKQDIRNLVETLSQQLSKISSRS